MEMLTPRALHGHIGNILRPPCWRVYMLAFWSTLPAESALPPRHEMREGSQLGSRCCSPAVLAPAISSLPAEVPDIRGREEPPIGNYSPPSGFFQNFFFNFVFWNLKIICLGVVFYIYSVWSSLSFLVFCFLSSINLVIL